ncbi:enoyl-CoA hydratase/isomerase family protein [Verminephrobacter eiseniae]|uniref:enoyl-CoA hydratase/isomerase family protein n=1 Tax=Verminephrobacter eiseniae TaxID=364317 RepID=UPI002237A27C|nr:enoyl-CoA hydratase/isomerase family protein [Verminephrobacter eiseniae]MCW5262100.1 enoyl-CoA hydratase/isomerase family protein [Verminephrobacter eiseniae]
MSAVRYQVHAAVAEITLEHPPVNALTEEMVGQLLDALQRAAADAGVRAVVLASAVPRRFCAGLDLQALNAAPPEKIHALLDKLYTALCDAQFRLGKPSIAAVAGAARGGGMTLAISCDMLVAGRSATFGYPEIDVGLLPAIHFTHLPRIVGRHRAFDLLFTGRSFGAAEAMGLGIVSRVVDDDLVLQEARSIAQRLAGKAPSAMRIGRMAFLRAIDNDTRRGVAAAVETFCAIATSGDGREGVAAFCEKRQPVWPQPQPQSQSQSISEPPETRADA